MMNRFISVVSLVSLSTIAGLLTLAPNVTAQTLNSGSNNTETLNVDLTATYNDNLSAGDYTFTINLVANP